MSDKHSTCCTCGYTWLTGRDGSHSCTTNLRKNVLVEFEELRQGFADAVLNSKIKEDKVLQLAMEAYHAQADRLVVKYGGDSVK